MENLTKSDFILIVIGIYLFFRLFKELAWIKLYSFIIKLKAEGKLIPENDPANISTKTYEKLLKQQSRFL